MIRVIDYDASWPRRFEMLRDEYSAAFTHAGIDVITIEHVGSTSVPGLAAKPVIDCDIVVTAELVSPTSDVLVGLGFRPLGELGIPERWAFAEPPRLAGTNTYVIVEGSLSLRNHLRFRDLLRTDPELRDRYGAVKKDVGAVADSIESYGQGKNAMIQQILAAAGLSDEERQIIDDAQIPTRNDVPR